MTTVSYNGTFISHNLGDGESVTVPSGEVWNVNITTFPKDYFRINGDVVMAGDSVQGAGGWYSWETVFAGGDTLKKDGSNSRVALVKGHEVSSTVDNTVVSETLNDGQSLSPATGEVWEVTISAHGYDRLKVNGNSWKGDANNLPMDVAHTYLDENDTVSYSGNAGRVAHFGGFKV